MISFDLAWLARLFHLEGLDEIGVVGIELRRLFGSALQLRSRDGGLWPEQWGRGRKRYRNLVRVRSRAVPCGGVSFGPCAELNSPSWNKLLVEIHRLASVDAVGLGHVDAVFSQEGPIANELAFECRG